MHVRCPHCHNAIELVGVSELTDVSCPSCGSGFNVYEVKTEAPPTRTVGHFQLVQQLGSGAFGTVWKARDTELDRFVAVKIPRRDQVEPEHVEMFLREARAAAQLKHPQIVAVHEVGREDGTLYIVSDFIQGVTLADRLTLGPYPPREAAELCAQIADALHHAHEAGVIHRDLKPHNIMLDGEGRPHIMDFGLAKREAGEITMTVDGKILGTAAYMSPEQARGEAHRVDRRTDIYSLGVILFECLTGERPFRGNFRMLLHQVIHDEPPSPRRLSSSISRDAETIALKCLEKDPRRRYQTANDVAYEIREHLRGHAIRARPVSRVEHWWRWSRRNPAIAVLSAALATTLLIGMGVSLLFAITATMNADRADAHATKARLAGERAAREAAANAKLAGKYEQLAAAERKTREQAERSAEAVANALAAVDLLRNVFRVADPVSLGGRPFGDDSGEVVTARQLLDLAVENVESELAGEPLVYAAMFETLGDVYRGIGELDKSEPLLIKSLQVREERLPEDHEDVAASRFALGWLRHEQGRFVEADLLYRKALAVQERVFGDHDRRTATTRFQLAWLLSMRFEQPDQLKLAEAETLLVKVVAARKADLRNSSRDIGLAQIALGFLQLARGREIAALATLSEGLATLEGNDSISQLAERYVHYKLYWRQGRRVDAMRVHEEVVTEFARLAGDTHPIHVLLLGEHAGHLREMGNHVRAEEEARRALALGQKTSFRWHFVAIDAWRKLGDAERDRGDKMGARRSYQNAYEVAVKQERSNDVAILKERLASVGAEPE